MSVRVLLLTPAFYGIETTLQSVLKQSGFEVTWIENKSLPFDYHGTKSKLKFLRKLYFMILLPQAWYLGKQLKKTGNIKFDILFAINAHLVCRYLFRKIRSKNPELYSVLYLWDSFSMFNWRNELTYFNKVYTFDRDDSIRYQIEYKPNFYIAKSVIFNCQKIKYDLFFVGKFSPARLLIIDKLLNKADAPAGNYFIRLWPAYKNLLHNSFLYWFLKKTNNKNTWVKNYLLNFEASEGIIKRNFFLTSSITSEEVLNYLLSSNVILDLPYHDQSGYTHRIIEALSCGKKVITTNSKIREEKFYNIEQIKIIDEKNPEIDYNWIREKSTFPIHNYILDLELSKWLNSIINAANV